MYPAMEGSESEAVFDSYNLNPQLFINEVLNVIDDMVDGAFDYYQQEASAVVAGNEGTDRSQQLSRGISSLRYMIQAVLDKRMGMWEKYCLQQCFVVPEGFQLPKDVPTNSLLQDGLSDSELDTQLASLREKLVAAGRESVELHRKIQSMEMQSDLQSSYDASVAEALHLLEENSMQDLVKELEKTASTLHPKMKALKSKRDDMKCSSSRNHYSPSKRHRVVAHDQGLSANLEDLQIAADILKNM